MTDIPDIDIEAFLAKSAPSELPRDVLAAAPKLAASLRGLDPIATVAILAGLQTDPRFQANTVRLDWATRLVLALSRGAKKPSRADLDRLLNVSLPQARIAVLEDPIEDFFVEPIPTQQGDFLIFTGTWEQAGFYTETLIDAFSSLPEGEPKDDALQWCSAALRISSALVARSGVGRRHVGAGDAAGALVLPSERELKALGKRSIFSWEELEALGVSPPEIYPFTLSQDHASALLDQTPGNSALEFHPLVTLPHGVLIASPANLSTAARALLISTAVDGGQAEGLRRRLFQAQARAVADSGFERLDRLPMGRSGDFLISQAVREVSRGRFVHLVQVLGDFANWPAAAFGSMIEEGELGAKIVQSIRWAKGSLEERGDFREAVTFCFLGGWGRGGMLSLPMTEDLAGWEVVFLSPGDEAAIARCDEGSIRDLWRLQKLRTEVERQGFELWGVNGDLNLFHWWRITDHALVPPNWIDMTPPALVALGSDHLLEARREGFEALDRRALPYPDGPHRIVARLDPAGYVGGLEPIYASLNDVRRGELLGAVVVGPQTVWLRLAGQSHRHSFDRYETWRAALKWLNRVLPAFWRRHAAPGLAASVALSFVVEFPDKAADDAAPELNAAIVSLLDDGEGELVVVLAPTWHAALRGPVNTAEVEMAAFLLSGVARLHRLDIPLQDLRDLVVEASGSPDIRWRHHFMASRAIDVLKHHGLVGRMRSIPVSAGALAKCGAAWRTRPREQGPLIEGEQACGNFLVAHGGEILVNIVAQVRRYNRRSFIVTAFAAIQAAQAEDRQWEMTARASRAIHGAADDYRGSLQRHSEINAVIRSATMLIEIANAEALVDGGVALGDMDLAELQAEAMLHFQICDLVPAVYSGFVKPELKISPTGDVLSDRLFEERTLRRSAERRHGAERERSSNAYASLFDEPAEVSGPDAALSAALSAEFGVDADAFLDLPAATSRLAGDANLGVMVLSRNDLVALLEDFEAMEGKDLSPLIDRMTMPPRAGWNDIPSGFSKPDFDLAKFDRRASLVGRPIVALTSGDNPDLVIAPGIIERAVFHNLTGAMKGSLQNDFWTSAVMRKFASEAGKRSGLDFNDRLAQLIGALGLRAWPSAKPAWCLNCKATPQVEQLGDIDVLAVSPDGARVWVIEAKDLKLCRTLGETTRRLSEYRGVETGKGKPDKMLKHLRRVTYIRDHASQLTQRLGLTETPKVSGLVVVRAPQPMEHFDPDTPDGRVVMVDDLNAVPWAEG